MASSKKTSVISPKARFAGFFYTITKGYQDLAKRQMVRARSVYLIRNDAQIYADDEAPELERLRGI